MNPDAGPRPDDPEFEATIETAAEDVPVAVAEPVPGAAPDDQSPGEEEPADLTASGSAVSAGPEPAEFASAVEPGPAPKLERLQKILAQAGVASRRHAEELIAAGRVQVNGQVVTTPGSKADPARDHIRVDGKLIHSAERLRYFMLNKPRGFVTTVSDPEGRPTVMQFFGKAHERLYPVGRLDYQSEGLLLVTNDGELANRLTRAASGVEKTYLVKVSGRPTAAGLDALRHGVAIDRGLPGTSRVGTAPARVREVRKGSNPWFEVVLIEGRNRELRKMFQEIGHFVEKIRRVGYGPLVLDLEPGRMRELTAEEIAALRRAADGKRAPMQTKSEFRRDRGSDRKRDHLGERRRDGEVERRREQRPRPGRWDGQAAEKPGSREVLKGPGLPGSPTTGPRRWGGLSRAEKRPSFSPSSRASAREGPDRRDRPAGYHAGASTPRESGGARPGRGRRITPGSEEGREFASRPRGNEGRGDWRARNDRRRPGSTASGFRNSPAGPARRGAGANSPRFESRDERRGGQPTRGRDRFAPGAGAPGRYRGENARGSAPGKDRRQGHPATGSRRDHKRSGRGRQDRH